MDHNAQLSKMDPKLKEAYERVMGLGTQTAAQHSSPVQNEQKAPAQRSQVSAQSVSPTESQISADEIPRMEVPLRRSTETVHFGGPVSTTPIHHQSLPILTTVNQKKKKHIPAVLMIFVVTVFFIIYAIFWIKILAVPIPFLTQ